MSKSLKATAEVHDREEVKSSMWLLMCDGVVVAEADGGGCPECQATTSNETIFDRMKTNVWVMHTFSNDGNTFRLMKTVLTR